MGKIRLILFLLFSFLVLFFISCGGQNSGIELKACSGSGDCKATQHCKFKDLDNEIGVCFTRIACTKDDSCDNNLKCIETFDKSFCGTRNPFQIKEITLPEGLVNHDYLMEEAFEVENASSLNYLLSVVDETKLPTGLSLVDGKLIGKISSEPGDYTFSLRAINGDETSSYYLNYKEAIKEFTIKVSKMVYDCDNSCSGNTSCNEDTNNCDCNDGYAGTNCLDCDQNYHKDGETCIADETCEANPCTQANKNICEIVLGVAICSCNDNYNGENCENCDSGFHRVGETCVEDEVCDDNSCTGINKNKCEIVAGITECSCNDNYNGDNCENCDSGFHRVGDTCVEDETCESNPCTETNKTACEVVAGVTVCSCDSGFHNEEDNCVIDQTCVSHPCNQENKNVCTPTNGLVVCSCNSGYHEEVGACVIDQTCETHPCEEENKTTCDVSNGFVVCSCNDGYHDVAGTCTIDETCEGDPCQDPNRGVCNIENGLRVCSCDEGYYEENLSCVENLSIAFCSTQHPLTITENNVGVWGHVEVDTITNSEDISDLIKAQLCYFLTSETNENSTCIDATFNNNVQNGNKDEYEATFTVPENGIYNYYYQFKVEGFTDYKKCDLRTNDGNGTNYKNGETYEGATGSANITDIVVQEGNLFISEYIEGHGMNKFLEFYAINGPVNLSGWKIKLAMTGDDIREFPLTTNIILNDVELAEGETYVIRHINALNYPDGQTFVNLDFNGNDTIGLFNPEDELVDIIGYLLGDNFAKDKRLIRKSNILTGNIIYTEAEWNLTSVTGPDEPVNQQDNLGSHTIAE